MKTVLFLLGLFLFVSSVFAGDVAVKGYYRKDGTYVRPHHRSSPDGDTSNNYGPASYQQRQQYKTYTTLPSYNNDYDNDGTPNRHDADDDNDGVSDRYDSRQYSTQSSSRKTSSYYSQPSYISTSQQSNNNQNTYYGYEAQESSFPDSSSVISGSGHSYDSDDEEGEE